MDLYAEMIPYEEQKEWALRYLFLEREEYSVLTSEYVMYSLV